MLSTALAAALATITPAGFNSLDLANYELTGAYALPSVAASEASAVTYNWDTGTLFVLGDEGEAVVEVSKTGRQISVMNLTAFEDTEGLTYIGDGNFVLAEERIQDVFLFNYQAGATLNNNNATSVSLGPTVGNIGLEGVSFDPITGQFILVKEKMPQRVITADIDWSDEDAEVNDLFTPDLGVADLSDVQALSTVPSLIGTADQDNILIYSQESALLMEVTRAGDILSTFDFGAIAGNAEGVTIGPDGVIYIVGEDPTLYVLTPIPAPASLTLFACAPLAAARRRRH